MNAVGKYQIIASTMKQAMKAMGLSGNEKFTPELQEKIFREFLIPKRKGLNDYLKGGETSLDRAQYEAAMEWASIPVPKGFKTQSGRISDGTVTYYDTNKGNRAKKGHGGKIRAELQNLRSTNAVKNKTPSGSDKLANFAQNADMPNIQSYAPPQGNPHKSQVNNSNMSASNVTIHQSFKTDMTLNGVSSPIESANAVKRQQENSMVIAARGAKSLIG
jgi:hypothetical protein